MTMPMTNNAALDGGRETVVQFDHLQHVYPGGVEALKDINLSFRKGEIVAIIGQNGSGKTTLSKHFNGLLRPTSGTVKVCGRDIGKVRTSDLAKTVGYVFQNPNYQIFCASVRDEIKYGLKNLKLPENEIKTRTKEILAQFGLTSVAKTQPVSLSGGTKKVVALASVCAMDPSILLLDEPTTGQDQPGKQRLGQLMLSLSASGKTIIVISHDMNFVARYAQRVIVMAEGRVIGDDTPARIFSNESVMKQAHVQPPQVYAVVNELRREGQSIPEEAYLFPGCRAGRRDERSRAMQSVTLYYPGTSFFHLCDCRVKLLLMLIFTVIAFLFYNPIVPAALFIAALLMNLSAIGTRTFKNFLFKMILVMMAFLLVLHGFANPNGSVPAQFWGHQLRIPFFGCYTVDGFYLGLVFWLRLSSIVLIAMLFVTTTSSAEIMRGLQKLGVPFRFCFMLTMSLQLIPITAREAGIIGSAQRARGLPEKNFIDKLKGLVPMFVPMVVSSLSRMETMSMALESRAFGNTKHPTEMTEIRVRPGDLALLAAGIILMIVAIVIRVRFGSLNWASQVDCWSRVLLPQL